MCVRTPSGSPSSRWFGKGATSSIVTADVDVPDKVLRSGSIWQKCERRGRARHFCCGLGHQEQEREEKWRRRTAPDVGSAAAGTCDRAVKVGRPRVCSNCRDNEVVGPIPLSLDWEVLSVMVASVDQYEDFRAPRGEPKGGLSPSTEERIAVLEKCGSDLPTVPVEGERIKRLKEEWRSTGRWRVPGQRSIRVPREYDRVSSAPVVVGESRRISLKSARQHD
jgi:hypothetical protein